MQLHIFFDGNWFKFRIHNLAYSTVSDHNSDNMSIAERQDELRSTGGGGILWHVRDRTKAL